MNNPFENRLLPAVRNGGYKDDNYWIWCGSAIVGDDGRYHLFASRWEKKYGFSANWLYRCEIVRCASDTPEGPYQYEETVLSARSAAYFDGRNVHNPCIRCWNGKYYLYYMGTTYGGDTPMTDAEIADPQRFIEVWNNKRIGVAVADSVLGPWKRPDKPLLLPRDYTHWDCTAITNPAVAILPNGTTYLLYKSRRYANDTLQIGVARADQPDGEFVRISDEPIFQFENPDFHVEDPYLWYEDGKFRLLIKDDFKHDCGGITGVWGGGFYAESDDCIHWSIPAHPLVYSRHFVWDDGSVQDMTNAERPFLLLQDGHPTHLFLAVGEGDPAHPYQMTRSYNACIPLKQEQL